MADADRIDPTFTALPYRRLADAALSRARDLGVSHADFRFERVRYQHVSVRDGHLQGAEDVEDLGFAVRVIHHGAWGFASGVVLCDWTARLVGAEGVEHAKAGLQQVLENKFYADLAGTTTTQQRIRLMPTL